ncbi:MAG: GDSL-type esterase/lipase family protein [Candidatus Gastranaerophilales bacterium]|nr:GDSL-type esterase/lipase family protein [Candidatus Gastranaerophilales bacterium]
MKKILCFGDSNTYGYNPQTRGRYPFHIRWTGILQKLCTDKYKIIEAGCNNRTCFMDNPDGIEQTGCKILPKYLSSDLDIIILALGINDLQFFYNPTFEQIEQGIIQLIEIVKNNCPECEIILLSPSNINEFVIKGYFSNQFNRESINKSLMMGEIYKKTAERFSCKFLDLNTVASVSNADGLHYSEQAHEKIAKAVYNII